MLIEHELAKKKQEKWTHSILAEMHKKKKWFKSIFYTCLRQATAKPHPLRLVKG